MSAPAPPSRNDFVSVVRDNVESYGNRPTFTFVTEERGPGRTYREDALGLADLDRRARALAGRLHDLGLRDQAVMLLYPEGLDFLAAFLACLYARVIAVPSPLPALDAGRMGRTLRIIGDAGIACILTDSAHQGDIEQRLGEAGTYGRVRCLATDAVTDADPDAWSMPAIGPDTLAFLQYTSGSTSDPKGVMVSHGNLLANEAEIRRRIHGAPDVLGVGWVPHYHDMGLVGQLMQPLYSGFGYVLTSPITFIKRPALWFELITRHRATITVAPNFGYELALHRITDQQLAGLDLSSLRMAKNGAEPIRAATLERMIDRFGPVGFRPEAWMPCYGMAEATLFITGAPLGTGAVFRNFDADALTRNEARPSDELAADHVPTERVPADRGDIERGDIERGDIERGDIERGDIERAAAASSGIDAAGGEPAGAELGGSGGGVVRRLVSSGRPITVEVRIVEPETRAVLPERRVGEIWVGGGGVARGYRGRPALTREIFQAVTADGAGPYLRTGDLGFLSDGELYVTGRIKDLIIVNGHNIYAHDIEEAAQAAHPAAGTAAAFSLDGEKEQVIIVQEIRAAAAGDMTLTEVASLTRDTVARAFGLPALSIVLSRRGAVRRTTSGKVQRQLTRRAFLDGEIAQLASDLEPGVAGLLRVPA